MKFVMSLELLEIGGSSDGGGGAPTLDGSQQVESGDGTDFTWGDGEQIEWSDDNA